MRFIYMKNFLFIAVLLSSGLSGSLTVYAEENQARAIMEKVDARDDGDNRTSDMKMVLIDKHGKKRTWDIHSFSQDKGEDSLSLLFFNAPADLKNTGFLTWDYKAPNQDDDQWLYLPALRKTKRIASSDKSGSFMGSDFSYSDLTEPVIDDYRYTLKKEMKVAEHKVWVIEAIPRNQAVIDETGYSKSLLLVRQDNYVIIRSVSWLKGSHDLKYMDVKKLKKIDGIWVATDIHMTLKRAKKTRHKTIMSISNIQFNQKLDPNTFTIRQLEKGLH